MAESVVVEITTVTVEAASRARALLALGRVDDAIAVTAPFASEIGAPTAVLSAHAAALKAKGNREQALRFYKRAALGAPGNGVAQHNVAALLGDLRRFGQAREVAEHALAMGLQAPETHLVHGRALLGLGALEEAERAFRKALQLRPHYADAHRDLAQLIWMRSGSSKAAGAQLDAALAEVPDSAQLLLVKAKLLEATGDVLGAHAALAIALRVAPMDVALRLAALHMAILRDEPEEARIHADVAASISSDLAVLAAVCTARLGLGEAAEASDVAASMLARAPHNQMAWALQATAWRLLEDPRWHTVWNFAEMVRSYRIKVPPGWSDLPSYLADLQEALVDLHGSLRAAPFEQSLRGGSQTTQHLQEATHPAVRAFFAAVDAPIRHYLSALDESLAPLQARNTGNYAITGAWSVLLGRGGSHVDHVHTEGWLSSAFYVDVPSTVAQPGRQGWLRFGQPPFRTRPALDADHYVRPVPGTLVLFPSYIWHGTVPFNADERRLTLAFDVLPT
ncbi:MAG: hypothetical protein KJ703_05460 [Alphaproteobacteria bacterium]|nr:hypothetical protein [Alphaproteobacteria bacterium]MBU2271370.1 hypothetical protein [Alphaproteobacteria bacterium]MBU2419247.1 hypothetical protein [Alphaproteobacteria bacterium]